MKLHDITIISTVLLLLFIFLILCPDVFWPDSNRKNAWDHGYNQRDISAICSQVEKKKSGKLLAEFLKNQTNKHTSGFIYMFKSNKYPSKLKIGRTSHHVGVDSRLKQWTNRCGHKLSLLSKSNKRLLVW